MYRKNWEEINCREIIEGIGKKCDKNIVQMCPGTSEQRRIN